MVVRQASRGSVGREVNASGWSASGGVLSFITALAFLFMNPWGAVPFLMLGGVFFWLAHAIEFENTYYSDEAELKRFFDR